MNKHQKSHKFIATFFLLIFFPTIFPTNLFASNNGPVAPEATSFEPVDATDMVNLATGDMSYVLPLMNVPSPEGGYPLSLSYHAGVALDQQSSWVGLGWNLNPGAINRNVNNMPDDWNNGKSIDFIYSNLGTTDVVNIGVGLEYKIFNLGLDYTFVDGKGSGGVVSYGIGMGGIKMTQGIGFGSKSGYVSSTFSLGGLTAQASSDGVGVSVYGTGVYHKNKSTGFSLVGNSNSANFLGGTLSFSNISNTNAKGVMSISKSFNTEIPIMKGFRLRFGFSKINYSMIDVQTSNINGVLYFKDSYNMSTPEKKINYRNTFMDAREEKLEYYNPIDSRDNIIVNPSFPSYDNFSVSGQGIMQNIQPLLLESKTLILSGTNSNGGQVGNAIYNASVQRYHVGTEFQNKFMQYPNDPSINKIHFYGSGTNTSFIDKSLTSWTFGLLNTITDITNSDLTNSYINGNSSYDPINNRLKKETFIETYTNDQIYNNPSLIIEANNLDRNAAKNFAPKGIGAFKVTAVDGKVYHYSLPVYNYEMFMRSYDTEKGEDNKFVEKINTQPYATHWLLTAITGSDYVDSNSNGKVDNDDYGYWVDFDYGKWTDSYVWKKESNADKDVLSGSRGSIIDCEFKDRETSSSRVLGVKQIYYLNSINTRTHSALFIKSMKDDDKGNSIVKSKIYNDVEESIIYNDPSLATGVYFNDTNYNYNINLSGGFKTLRLDKIVLINQKDKSLFNLTAQQSPENQSNNSIEIKSTGQKSNILGQDLGSETIVLHNRNWVGGTFSNNVYLSNIINNQLLIEKSIKSIKFNYDYSLNKLNNAGKLTLKTITNYGKNDTNTIPPYVFEYYNLRDFNKDNYDLWGYDKNYPHNYSLKNIKNPMGNTINLEYEKDEFNTVLNNLHSKVSSETIKPTPKKFVRNSNGLGGTLEMIWNNPCYSIDQIYNCISPGNQFSLTLKKDSNPAFTVTANIISVSGNILYLSFVEQVPNYFTGDFYCCGNYIGGNNENCSYLATIDYGDCNVNNELIGKCNDSQGGLRVKNINILENNEKYIINYDYNNPDTNTSSGITASTPYLKNDYSFMFSNGVMYEYVTVSSKDKYLNIADKKRYQFNVLKPQIEYQFNMSSSQVDAISQYGEFYKINASSKIQNLDILADDVGSHNYMAATSISNTEIIDNISKIGNLVSVATLNSNNQILEKRMLNYANSFEDVFGTYSESFKTYRSIKTDIDTDERVYQYFVNSSKLKKIPSLLLDETIIASGYAMKTYYDKYDFLTGQLLEKITEASDGKQTKSKTILAYSKYIEMGSKVDNINNRNMLSQEAVNMSYIRNNSQEAWRETGIGITTWSNIWTYRDIEGNMATPTNDKEKIWRKHKSYVWNGIVDADGIFLSYDGGNGQDGFDWTVGIGSQPSQWKQVSETTLYDHFSMPLETKDMNNNLASTKMGNSDTQITVSGNAGYNEMFFTGTENIATVGHNLKYLEPQIQMQTIGTSRTTTYSHTGSYSVGTSSLGYIKINMLSGEHRTGKYKLSVWVHKTNEAKARVKIGTTVYTFNGEGYPAGDWVLKTHYLNINTVDATAIYLVGVDSTMVYYDDIMLRPVSSAITGYVYNEWNELTYIIGNNGLATKFEYDASGNLIKTYSEVIDDVANGVTGGFKHTTSNKINYKNL